MRSSYAPVPTTCIGLKSLGRDPCCTRFSSLPARYRAGGGNRLRSDRADPTQMSGFGGTIYTYLYISARVHFDAPIESGRCRHVSVTSSQVTVLRFPNAYRFPRLSVFTYGAVQVQRGVNSAISKTETAGKSRRPSCVKRSTTFKRSRKSVLAVRLIGDGR